MKGSDWILSRVLYLEVCFVNYVPLRGGNYIAEPSTLRRSKSLINVKNYKLNMKDIQYLVKLSQIERFEKQNQVSIKVFPKSSMSQIYFVR
jgi:hypothetical protein